MQQASGATWMDDTTARKNKREEDEVYPRHLERPDSARQYHTDRKKLEEHEPTIIKIIHKKKKMYRETRKCLSKHTTRLEKPSTIARWNGD